MLAHVSLVPVSPILRTTQNLPRREDFASDRRYKFVPHDFFINRRIVDYAISADGVLHVRLLQKKNQPAIELFVHEFERTA
jgi:hypothetical protein